MTNAAVRTITSTRTYDGIKERNCRKEEKAGGRLSRMIRFLFNSETENPYGLPESMKSKLYL